MMTVLEYFWKPSIESHSFEKSLQQFENCCIQNEKISDLFQEIRELLENPSPKILKSRDIFPFYIKAIRLAQAISQESNDLKHFYLSILQAAQGKKIQRIGAPPIYLNFDPLIKSLEKGTVTLSCKCEILDTNNSEQVAFVARAIDRLAEEGFGRSFGFHVFKTVLASPDSLCMIAKDSENEIVGYALGTRVCIQRSDHSQALKVFHIWFLVRKANYPLIHLVKMTKAFESELIQRLNPDFISLSVDVLNQKAKEMYENEGFKTFEVKYSSLMETTTAFMLKSFKQEIKEPSSEEITKEIFLASMRQLGMGKALFYQTSYQVTQFIRRWWYW